MPRQPIQAEYTTAIKGLITEASPFTYPENASLQETNFILNKDGSRSRRFGIDYEKDFALKNTGLDLSNSSIAVASHTWTAVSNIGDLEIIVVQVGNKLYFFKSNEGPISQAPVNGGAAITISGSENDLISTSSIYGNFIVAHGTQEVTILTYNTLTEVVTAQTKRLAIRDLFGVDDGIAVDERLVTISNAHRYNLYNQGWPKSIKTTFDLESVTTKDSIDATKEKVDFYPSNADVVWSCKVGSAKEVEAVNAYSPEELKKIVFGSTPAPLGQYIIDVFNRGASRTSKSGVVLSDKADQSSGGITSVASYAGRAFYAIKESNRFQTDQKSPNIGTMIFYSRADTSIAALTQCHSEADPTAEHVFDPIATDGGFITIAEAGQVLRLVPMGQSLFVFCSNGVWEIHGDEGQFSALNQNVSKTTDIAVASSRAVVYAEDKIAFWGLSGIYLINRNDLTLRGGNNDLTYNTIQTLYDNIPLDSKREAVGTYDPFLRTFRWLYRDETLPDSSFFNKELIFDTILSAFYIFDIETVDYGWPFVAGYVTTNAVLTTYEDAKVVVNSNDVLTVTDSVVVRAPISSGVHKGALKYLTVLKTGTTHKFTFSHFHNTKFRDWFTYDGVGVDAAASMLTGYATGGSAMVEKSIEYLHVYMKRTELGEDESGVIDPSSCTMQVQWEWTNSLKAGRWGRETEVYRLPRIFTFLVDGEELDYSYTTVITKNKVRGKGRALSILFKTKPYHNCVLYGWGIVGSAGAA